MSSKPKSQSEQPIPVGAYPKEIISAPSIQRMNLKPGDVIVISIPKSDLRLMEQIRRNMKSLFPKVKTIVKSNDISMKILRKKQPKN